jgi:cysteine sulfinate desulfinase/cysteine desulfurase-like protein
VPCRKDKVIKLSPQVAEHPAVTKTVRDMKRRRLESGLYPCAARELDCRRWKTAVCEKTALVSVHAGK